jgi:hypothetical protein
MGEKPLISSVTPFKKATKAEEKTGRDENTVLNAIRFLTIAAGMKFAPHSGQRI